MGRPLRITWRDSEEALYARYRGAGSVEARKRLQALWLVRRGEVIAEAARQVGAAERSVRRWLGWYREGGVEEVLRRLPGHGGNRPSGWLTPEQQQALVEKASAGAFRTYDEARRWVQQAYGVAYSYQGMYTVLGRLAVHPKVPRPTAAQADPKAQEAWKKGGSPRRSRRWVSSRGAR